jgi:hypothetical protein
LYQVTPNAAWRNLPATTQGALTATDKPPVALDLNYLITASGKGDDDLIAHLLLGRAAAALQDQAVLSPNLLVTTTRARPILAASNAHLQIERIRVTPKPINVDEMSRIWGMFQTRYRLSFGYQVSVVLIDPIHTAAQPLPVLSRGALERGQAVSARLDAQTWPGLLTINLPGPNPGAYVGVPRTVYNPAAASDTPGDALSLTGFALQGSTQQIVLSGLPGQYILPPPSILASTPTHITAQLPIDQAGLPAGPYLLQLRVTRPRPDDNTPQTFSSNQLPLAVAPQILQVTYQPPATGSPAHIALRCSPQVWPGQQVSLLVADREIIPDSLSPPPGNQAPPLPQKVNDLRFTLAPPLSTGRYTVRLRVDGVESFPIRRDGSQPTSFDPGQQVVIP